LKIRIPIHGHGIGCFERLEVRTHIYVEEFPINQQEPLGVGQARELGEILVFYLLKAGGANLGDPGGFIDAEVPREACFL
jgi:hypothetical protein